MNDDIRPARPLPQQPTAKTAVLHRRQAYYPPRPPQGRRSHVQLLQLPLLLAAGSFAGFFAETLAVGLAMLAVYAVVAFATRIPSRTTFTLALLLLAAICIMLLAKPSGLLIQNFSTYAFALMLIGVITLAREARLPKRTRRKYRR